LVGEKWRVVRQLFSPQLTGGKIKIMSPAMNDAVKDYVSDVKQKISKSKDNVLENYDLRR
jgi:cytochrome P450